MRAMIFQIRPLCTASGFIAMKVLSVILNLLCVTESYTKRVKDFQLIWNKAIIKP